MIAKTDVQNLENKYQLALKHIDEIERVNSYPCYPQEISDFMGELTQKPWFISYHPAEIANILNNIEQATIDEIRKVLTATNRAERFCDGAWENTLQSRMLEPVFKRLNEVITVL